MALDITEEQRKIGEANFKTAQNDLNKDPSRRDALKVAGGVIAVAPVAGAVYLGYEALKGKPVKAALIGCGDEGGVLLGEHDPDTIQFIAACDIRPYNKQRIIEGELARNPKSPRKGFKGVYGEKYAHDIRDNHFYADYHDMLEKEKDIEAVVIALPLHLHAPVTIECMEKYKKHVLCEKLMARDIEQCKQMIKAAKDNNRILSIGHQRHYSTLYASALGLIQSGILGDIKHIRALWHRNFSWDWKPNPLDPELQTTGVTQPTIRDGWTPPIYKMDYDALHEDAKSKYGYKDIDELIRWRLYQRTGGGLMAELGSHQLDAASIFLGKVHPLAVTGVGTHSFFGYDHHGKNPREIDDHVFVTFEFPGKNHPKGPNKGNDDRDVVVVTYSSVSTNSFEKYGECVMGSRGTLIVEEEKKGLLFKEPMPGGAAGGRDTTVTVKESVAGKPVLDSGATPSGSTAVAASVGAAGGDPSRGYKEEMADFAVCIRRWDEEKHYYNDRDDAGKYKAKLPRCHGEVAMADAILALTANLAMATHKRIDFDEKWFDAASESTPEGDVLKKRA
jgi:predicted dehydrogenase